MLSAGQIKVTSKLSDACKASEIKSVADKKAYCEEQVKELQTQIDSFCEQAFPGVPANVAICKTRNSNPKVGSFPVGPKFKAAYATQGMKLRTPSGETASLKKAAEHVEAASKTYVKNPLVVEKLKEAEKIIEEAKAKGSDEAAKKDIENKLRDILAEASKEIADCRGLDDCIKGYLEGDEFKAVLREMRKEGGIEDLSAPRSGWYLGGGLHLNLNKIHFWDSTPSGQLLQNQRGLAGSGVRDLLGGPGFQLEVGHQFDKLKFLEKIAPENFRLGWSALVKYDQYQYVPVLPGETYDVGGDLGKQIVTPQMANAIAETAKGTFHDITAIAKLNGSFFSRSESLDGYWFAGGSVGVGALFRIGSNEANETFITGSYETTHSQASQLGGFAVLLSGAAYAGYEHDNGVFVKAALSGHFAIHDTAINAEGLKIERTFGNGAFSLIGGLKF